MTGRNHRAHREEFLIHDSEYADDTALIFDSRSDTEEGLPSCISHFTRFGLEVT